MNSLPIWFAAALSFMTIVAIIAFSDRFSKYGLGGWKTALFGMILVFIAFLARAAMSVESFSHLFIPGMPTVVSSVSDMLTVVGTVFVAMSLFVSVRRLAIDRESDVQKESQLQFLDNLKNIIFEPYSLVEVLNFSLNEISRALDDCSGAIFIYNPSRRELHLASSSKLSQSTEAAMELIKLDTDIISRTQKLLRSHSVGKMSHSDKATQTLLSKGGIESVMAAPLMSRSGAVGVVAIFGDSPYQFSTRESAILSSAANLLGPVVASFRMEREIRQLSDQLSKASDKNRKQLEILSSLGPDKAPSDNLGILLEYSDELLHGEGVLLAVRGGEEKWRIARSTDDSPFGDDIPSGIASHFEKAADNGKPIIVKTHSPGTDEPLRLLVFPVGAGETCLGAIVALISFGTEKFSPDEISRMQIVLKLVSLLLSPYDTLPLTQPSVSPELPRSVSGILQATSHSSLASAVSEIVYTSLTSYDAGMLLLLTEDHSRFKVVSAFGYDGTKVAGFELEASGGPWSIARLRSGSQLYSERKELEELLLKLPANELSWFMQRGSGKKLPEFCKCIPLSFGNTRIGVLYLEGSEDSAELSAFTEYDSILSELLGFKLRQIDSLSDDGEISALLAPVSQATDSLNEVNNILTGIIGKAQLLGFGLKDEMLRERDSVLRNLDMLADEAFQAGEIVQNLQKAIRDEKPAESEPDSFDLPEALENLTMVRYGGDPSIRYLRDNPSVTLNVELNSPLRVSGDIGNIRAILNEALQYAWDEFGSEGQIYLRTADWDSYGYAVVFEGSSGDHELDFETMAFRSLGLHPDLSQSEAISSAGDLPLAFHEGQLDGDGRFFVLRFDRVAKVEERQAADTFNVLAIDDQEIIRELLSGMLQQLGYDVTVCASGYEGVEAFENGGFDLVITDIGLPDIDGWEVAGIIKKKSPDIPIIMISGWGLGQEVERASQMGIEHILPKPFRLENLSELIEEVKSRRATA